MKFVDLVKIKIKSGKGGDGMTSFRREKYVPRGGPSGGDGGHGGNIVFEGDENLTTLLDYRYERHRSAPDGENGQSKKKHGKDGEDRVLKVPVGTTIFNDATGKILADITDHGQQAIVLRGGRGGRGNVKFTTSRNTAPRISENGEPGSELDVRLELKLLADVGLIGKPSVGKSTILSVISKSRPKIADYHFTTIQPNLGVAGTNDDRSFVVADLPGLIEGASEGHGLGIQFLRHIERTRVILHVVDMSAFEGRDPYEDYKNINAELKAYGYGLEERPQVVIANKMDMPDSKENLEAFKARYEDPYPIIPISAHTHENIDKMLLKTADVLDEQPKFSPYNQADFEEHVTYTFEPEDTPFTIRKGDDGIFEIGGEAMQRLFEMTNFKEDESVRRFGRQLKNLGVDRELRNLGVENGDTVRIFDAEFEFVD
ncbi:MAG: GTPase ObgE [Bacillota bacterium]